jgi:pimeloyl-ACP methyl ester carboxylesterase
LRESVQLLDAYIASEGPFHGILGFSAGAVLAALYLMDKTRRGQRIPLKFGIFVASANNANEVAYLGLDSQDRETGRISIPTAHIWGANDESAPKGGLGISEMCNPVLRSTLVHSGGHEFPRSKGDLTHAAHVVQRTMQLAREQAS